MTALALWVALSAPACSRSAQPEHVPAPVPAHTYSFPLLLPDDAVICVETAWVPPDPCISLGRLRRMVREREAE